MTRDLTRLPVAPAALATQAVEHVVHLPAARSLAVRAAAHIAEAALIPGLTFYLVLNTVTLRWALIASLGWAYLVIAFRLVRRDRVPGVIIVSAGLLTARTAVSLVANSSFIYFLQPSLGNFCIALLFIASLGPGRPMTRRLADDFCALPPSMDDHPLFARFFARLTLLWATICAVNGAGTLLLLLHESVGSFIALRPVVSYGLVATGTVVSYLWFRKTVRGEGVRIAFGEQVGAAV